MSDKAVTELRIICAGSVHWDLLGLAPEGVPGDVPGKIIRRPGGVAFNLAKALRACGIQPILLGAVGIDRDGQELMQAIRKADIMCHDLLLVEDMPTDRFLAIEMGDHLVAAVADTRMLDHAGFGIFRPLLNHETSAISDTERHGIVIDANLSRAVLEQFAGRREFGEDRLYLVAASPPKAPRLLAFVGRENAMVFMNLEEAIETCGKGFNSALDAAAGLLECGFARAAVTDGPRLSAVAGPFGKFSCLPSKPGGGRSVGLGDVFAGSYIASELRGMSPVHSLREATKAATRLATKSYAGR